MRRLLLVALLVCSALGDTLRSAGTCSYVTSYFRDNALERVNPYGLGGGFFFGFRGFVDNPCRDRPGLELGGFGAKGGSGSGAEAAPQASAARSGGGSGSGSAEPVAGVDFSDTNIQVEGVDEPDIVKTDGKRVFVVQGKQLFVVKVAPGGMKGTVAGKLTLPTFVREMLIDGDNLLVIGSEFGELVKKPTVHECKGFGCGGGGGGSVGEPTAAFIRRPFPIIRGIPITVVYKVRVSGTSPRLISTLRMEGQYINSREVSGSARLILRHNGANSIPFDRKCDTAAEAIERHKRKIRTLTYMEWVPRFTLKSAWGRSFATRPRPLTSCRSIFLPTTDFTGFDLLTVVVLPLKGFFYPRGAVSISSQGREVYSTAKTLYVTATKYRYDFAENSVALGAGFTTSLHKFALSTSGAKYVASGTVKGSVLNQFSMHEYLGTFFAATTEGAWWWRSRDLSKSKVTSFQVSGRKLLKVGEVGNLGVGERIFSVRYVADQGYVVTFRQIDPLYVIDLSNPRRLRVTGELKIPGFSSYLHPIGPGRLVGVGREATPEGRTTGAKVSLFDVSDVNQPKEVAVWTLKGSYTSASFDHRAFLYWKPLSLLVLPVNVYSRNENERFSGSIALKITPTGIVEQGRISHPKSGSGRFASSPRILRNLVLGRINLWSLATKTLQVNDISSLGFKSIVELQ